MWKFCCCEIGKCECVEVAEPKLCALTAHRRRALPIRGLLPVLTFRLSVVLQGHLAAFQVPGLRPGDQHRDKNTHLPDVWAPDGQLGAVANTSQPFTTPLSARFVKPLAIQPTSSTPMETKDYRCRRECLKLLSCTQPDETIRSIHWSRTPPRLFLGLLSSGLLRKGGKHAILTPHPLPRYQTLSPRLWQQVISRRGLLGWYHCLLM
jgi:hypothetical protein